jgi:MFS family permease
LPNYYVYSYLDLAFLMVSPPPRRMPDSLAALFVFAFCLVMIASSRGMGETYAIFLLPLSETFGWNRANVTSIYAIYMVAFGFGSLLSGLVFDRFGPRFNYMIGLTLLAGCYGFAGKLDSLVSFYLVIGICGGIGAAMVGIVPTQSLISRWFHRRRGTVLSIAYSGQGIGVMLLAPAAQLAIQQFGWQQAYGLASLGFVMVFILMVFLPWRRIAAGMIAPENPADDTVPPTKPCDYPNFGGFLLFLVRQLFRYLPFHCRPLPISLNRISARYKPRLPLAALACSP